MRMFTKSVTATALVLASVVSASSGVRGTFYESFSSSRGCEAVTKTCSIFFPGNDTGQVVRIDSVSCNVAQFTTMLQAEFGPSTAVSSNPTLIKTAPMKISTVRVDTSVNPVTQYYMLELVTPMLLGTGRFPTVRMRFETASSFASLEVPRCALVGTLVP